MAHWNTGHVLVMHIGIGRAIVMPRCHIQVSGVVAEITSFSFLV